MTNGDVLYIGSQYTAYDNETNNATAQDAQLLKESAERFQHAYLDCMSPSVSYAWMTNNGFMADEIHPNLEGYEHLTKIAWRELGFFALRVDRQLAIHPSVDAIRLDWATTTNVVYELQSSVDMKEWVPLQAFVGKGSPITHTITVEAETNRFFRLNLTGDW